MFEKEELKMKKDGKRKRYALGDLIVALYEEASKVSSQRGQQTLMVYAALKDLLTGPVKSKHPIALKA